MPMTKKKENVPGSFKTFFLKNKNSKKTTLCGKNSPFFISVIVILTIIFFDQLTKYIALQNAPFSFSLIEGFLWLTYVENFGAGFGLFQGFSLILGVGNFLIAGVLLFLLKRQTLFTLETLSLSFVIGGAIGNGIDRLFLGFVIDFIDLGWWPVFNIADTFLVLGVLLLIFVQFSSLNGVKK